MLRQVGEEEETFGPLGSRDATVGEDTDDDLESTIRIGGTLREETVTTGTCLTVLDWWEWLSLE